MLRKLTKIWSNRKAIFEGVWNNLFKKNYVERIASERKAICWTCPDYDMEGTKCEVPGTHPCCGICGCSLKFKLRSLSSDCGNEDNPLWHSVLTQEDEDAFKESINYKEPNG
jgi:hypothetical protein